MTAEETPWWKQGLKGDELIKASIEHPLANLIKSYGQAGYELDYSSPSLRFIDEYGIAERLLCNTWVHLSKTFAYVSEGAYLGEVIVRNLGGRWRYPSRLRISCFFALMALGFPLDMVGGMMFKRCHVMLGDRPVPVMRIADLRLNKRGNDKVRSLFHAYELIQKSGGRDWALPARCPACGARARGRKYCGKCGRQLRD